MSGKTAAGLTDSPWPIFHGDSKLTGQSKYDTSKVDSTVKWRFKANAGIEASTVIGSEGIIYFADHTCTLFAVNPDGSQKWTFKSGEPITSIEWWGKSCSQSTPAVAKDGTIYYLPMTGNFYAINPDGTEKWKRPVFTFKNSWSSPTIDKNGSVYIGSEMYPPRETKKPMEKPGYIYAFNPDGSEKWSFTNGSAGGTSGVPSITDDGTLIITGNDMEQSKQTFVSKIVAFNPDNGAIKWRFWPKDGVPEGSVTIGKDGTLYFGAKGSDDPRIAFFYALTPEGKEKWKFPLTEGMSVTPGVANDGTIYIGDWGGRFYALTSEGKEKWHIDTPKAYEALSSSPAIGSEGTVYFGSITKMFYALNPDGTEKWKYDTGGGIVSAPAIGSDGTVYVTTTGGHLFAFGEKKDAVSTQSSEKKISAGSNKLYLIGEIAVFAIIFFISIFLYVKRSIFANRKKLLLIFIAFLSLLFLTDIFAFYYTNFYSKQKEVSNNQEQTGDSGNSSDVSCPDHIYNMGAGKYYITIGEKNEERKELSQDEVEKIRKTCKNTVWPNKGNKDNNSGNNGQSPSAQQPNSGKYLCPHHIYGTEENGFYGAYTDMTTHDLLSEELSWVKSNCPNATWPEQYRKDKN